MTTITMDPILIAQFVAATILPLLVAIVTTRVTSPARKATYLATLALATSLLAEAIPVWQNGETFDLGVALFLTLPTFITAVGTHFGLWKPTGVAETVQASVGVTGN